MKDRGSIIALEGPSASGKTTIAVAAARRFGWRELPEAFARLDPAPSLEFDSAQALLRLEGTLLVEDARRYREARAWSDQGETVLADTGFLGSLTYTRGLVALHQTRPEVASALEDAARELVDRGVLGIPDMTVYLETTSAGRTRRARADPAGHPASLAGRHEAVAEFERQYLFEILGGVSPGRLRPFRPRGELDSVVSELGKVVQKIAVPAATREETRRFVDALQARRSRTRNVGPNR